MRIAIIGGGVAGLTAAQHLYRDHDITLYEAADYAGGHSHTVDVVVGGRHLAVDTGFIVYNERNYPCFTALLAQLGIATQPSDMSFSLSCAVTGLEYNGSSLNTLFCQRSNLFRPSFHRMIRDILRLNRCAGALVQAPEGVTLGEFLAAENFNGPVVDDYLLPMAGAIWSADPATILDFPACHFGRFFQNHGLFDLANRPQWRTVRGGSREYVRALTAPFRDRIRLGTPVEWVRRLPDQVMVKPRGEQPRGFDRLVVACHADQALRLLRDSSASERDILGAIPFQDNEAVLHTDQRLLPRHPRARASWNYNRFASRCGRVTVTYNLTALQRLPTAPPLLLTLNATDLIEPQRIMQRMVYAHPVYNRRSMAAQARRDEISGINRTYYCGAYWGYGFHEDGVRSGLAVANAINGQPQRDELHLRRVG